MIQDLIKLVTQKANISEGAAGTAVNTVINFLKDKLPAPIANQIDGVLGNTAQRGQQQQDLGNFGAGLGDMLRKDRPS